MRIPRIYYHIPPMAGGTAHAKARQRRPGIQSPQKYVSDYWIIRFRG
jgi:hypothetical protein